MTMRFVVNGLLFVINFVCSQNLPDTYPTSTTLSVTTTGGLRTTTASECDAFTPAPDYIPQCNATNSFTLPNGRLVDRFWKFCGCAIVGFDARKATCKGLSDHPVPDCNADGTFNCRGLLLDTRVCVNSRGEKPRGFSAPNPYPICDKEAYCQSACIRYSKELKRFQNVGGCNCTLARSQEMDSSLPASDSYVPQCNADGSWQRKQTGYGLSWCVDSTGNPTGDTSFGSLYAAAC